MLADDDGVGHGQYGRRVQDDVVVALAGVGKQLVETVVHQKLGRIARIAAAADEVEVFNAGFLYGFGRSCFAVEDVRQAELWGKAEESVEVAFAHIGIDKQNAFARLRHYGGEVGGDKGFACFRRGTGNHEDVVRCVQHGEVDIGAQGADGFDGSIGSVFAGQQIVGTAAGFLEFAFEEVAFLLGFGVRNKSDNFQIEVFDFFG